MNYREWKKKNHWSTGLDEDGETPIWVIAQSDLDVFLPQLLADFALEQDEGFVYSREAHLKHARRFLQQDEGGDQK